MINLKINYLKLKHLHSFVNKKYFLLTPTISFRKKCHPIFF